MTEQPLTTDEIIQKLRMMARYPTVTLPRDTEALKRAADLLAQPAVKLQNIEQYRMQMAGISTAALGYWKEGDSIHPDYDTLALRDVAKLYAKYDKFFEQQALAQPSQRNQVLEEVALEFDKMPFGTTAQSFATFVRDMKT